MVMFRGFKCLFNDFTCPRGKIENRLKRLIFN